MTNTASILIVDDEAAQLRALCDALQDQGYAISGFTSARAALEELRKEQFDLLLTDLLMPDMDGIELLRAALDADANLVGVLMTGNGTISTAVGAMQAGALDYILKPFKLNAILPVLNRALAVRKLRLENAELARRVQQRTQELETANKELDAFAFSVSHDLSAPLRIVAAMADMLTKEATARLTARDQQLLATIRDGSAHMKGLIDGLLNLSRLGRQSLVKAPLDLDKLVARVVEELTADLDGRQVKVVLGELPDCQGDHALIRQVYSNLLGNAFKFTRNTQNACIEIGCEYQRGERVYFIRDNGAGFDMQYASRLFSAFRRLHKAEDFEGTGIGLSIVQRIIHRHGGQIWAEADVGHGATFYFTLPG